METLGTYYRGKRGKAVGLRFGVGFVVWFVWALFFFFLSFDLLPKLTYQHLFTAVGWLSMHAA